MGAAQATPIAMEDQSQLKVPGVQAAPQFVPPAESAIPDNAFGKMPPAADSPQMTALSVYAYWLSTQAPTGVEIAGRGYPEVPKPKDGYDFKRGEQVRWPGTT
ncbi:hypothetical protein WR25_26201 [Diploscapter pachys]|uniref:Uncharacterized protein n=1 Tax=Diploscapter pachys TaxID=2018661 RepID=A0A2A2KBQ5_9BILA|nr:hypothetical protein WR25_26201 [Diploscapter pachys]